MPISKSEQVTYGKPEELKAILTAAGPWLSIYMPLSMAGGAGPNTNGTQNRLVWKETLATVENKASEFGVTGRALLDSVRDWKELEGLATGHEHAQGKSIAIFRSQEVFQTTFLDQEVAARAVLAKHAYIRPLLAELVQDRTFYLLALSQKDTRLVRCTRQTSEEVRLAGNVQNSFETWMNQVKPDHTAVNNAMTASAAGGGQPSALAPKGSDDEAKYEYLSHFFKQIATGVNETLKGRTEPLVLCAVEYEVPLYRKVNLYPHLASEAVHGAPNSLKSGEMRSRAIECLGEEYEHKVDAALAEWNHRAGGGASSRTKDVVTAAHDGRVLTLLVSDSQELLGSFEEETNLTTGRATASNRDEDLINDAAIQALLHASKVLVVPHHKMPHGSPLAATFRY